MQCKVTANFHPTLTAFGQLDEVRGWFERVFARPTDGPSAAYLIDGYSNDYCFTTLLQEVYFDVMDPSRFSSSNNPPPPAGTPPFMSMLAFYLEDLAPLIAKASEHEPDPARHQRATIWLRATSRHRSPTARWC